MKTVLIILTALFIVQCGHMSKIIAPIVNAFYKHQSHYDKTYRELPLYDAAYKTAAVFPQNATIKLSNNEWSYQHVVFRYFLFPNQLSENWQYYIDFDQSPPPASMLMNKLSLDYNIDVYAKPGVEFAENRQEPTSPSFFYIASAAIVFGLISLLAGFFLLVTMKIPVKKGGTFWFLGSSYLAGYGLLTMVLWVILLFKIPFTKSLVWSVWGGVLMGMFYLAKGHVKSCLQELKPAGRPSVSSTCMSVFLAIVFLSLISHPVYVWDALSHWLMKSKIFFHHNALDFSYTHHNLNPLLWPLAVAAQYVVCGGTYEGLASWVNAFIVISFFSQLYGAVKFLNVREDWRWWPVIFFISFFFCSFFYYKTPEPVLMAYMTGTIAAILAWMKYEKRHYFYLALMMTWGLSLSKLEGGPSSMILAISLIMAKFKNSAFTGLRKSNTPGSGAGNKTVTFTKFCKKSALILFLFSLPVLFIVIWGCWLWTMGYPSTPEYLQEGFTLQKMSNFMGAVSLKLMRLKVKIFFFLILVGLAMSNRSKDNRTIEQFLFYAAAGLVLFSFAANMGIPTKRMPTQANDALWRLLLHASPAMTLWWGLKIFPFQKNK